MEVNSFRNKNHLLETTIGETMFDATSDKYINYIEQILEGDFQENIEKFKKIKLIMYGKRKNKSVVKFTEAEKEELKKLKLSTLEATIIRCLLGGKGGVQLAQYVHYLVAIVSRYKAEKKIVDVKKKTFKEKQKEIPELTAEQWKDKKFDQIGKNVQVLGAQFLESLEKNENK